MYRETEPIKLIDLLHVTPDHVEIEVDAVIGKERYWMRTDRKSMLGLMGGCWFEAEIRKMDIQQDKMYLDIELVVPDSWLELTEEEDNHAAD